MLDQLKEKYKDNWLFHIQNWSSSLHIFIVEKNGHALVKLSKESYDDAIYISDLYVIEEYRGRHLGHEMIKIAEEIAEYLDINALELDAYKCDWTVHWYERLGFKIDNEDELVLSALDISSMRKELNK